MQSTVSKAAAGSNERETAVAATASGELCTFFLRYSKQTSYSVKAVVNRRIAGMPVASTLSQESLTLYRQLRRLTRQLPRYLSQEGTGPSPFPQQDYGALRSSNIDRCIARKHMHSSREHVHTCNAKHSSGENPFEATAACWKPWCARLRHAAELSPLQPTATRSIRPLCS